MSKPGVRQKPKPPPYPRPVPQFVVEELPPQPVDVAWNAVNGGGYYSDDDGGGKDEVVLEQRAAKRRRIEACATACLRGEPLYIMSAQLKGPFNKGWRNPWAKRKRVLKVVEDAEGKSLEIPETARKIPSSVEEERSSRGRPATPEPRLASAGSMRRDMGGHAVRLEQAPSPFTSRVQKLPDETSPKIVKLVKEKRVQDWLRTNDAFAKTSEILVHSSPTPTGKRRETPVHSRGNGSVPKASQSEPPKSPSPITSPLRTTRSLQPQQARNLSSAQKRIQNLSRNMQNMLAEPTALNSDGLQDEVSQLVDPSLSSKRVGDSSRAEYAIFKARKGGLQTVPAIAHMSPFEFRKAPGKDQEGGVEQHVHPIVKDEEPLQAPAPTERTVDAPYLGGIGTGNSNPTDDNQVAEPPDDLRATNEDVFATAPQPEMQSLTSGVQNTNAEANTRSEGPFKETEQAPALNVPYAALSTAVSEISTTDMLPSAQPRLEPQVSVSSATHEKLLSIKPAISASENVEGQADPIDDVRKGEEAGNTHRSEPLGAPEVPVRSEETPRKSEHQSSPVSVVNVADLSTQEMLANIEQLEFSTVKKSKIISKKGTPATATRARSDKKRKKASFAVESSGTLSHGSIKDAMKAKVSKQLASPPLFRFSKDDLNIEVSDDDNEPQHRRLKQSAGPSRPKSILKSTNPTSSPNSLRKSKSLFSTGQEQDERQRNLKEGQNGIHDDNFDLDAAIDDLGSFLGTWDAEKEASSLDIEL